MSSPDVRTNQTHLPFRAASTSAQTKIAKQPKAKPVSPSITSHVVRPSVIGPRLALPSAAGHHHDDAVPIECAHVAQFPSASSGEKWRCWPTSGAAYSILVR